MTNCEWAVLFLGIMSLILTVVVVVQSKTILRYKIAAILRAECAKEVADESGD